MTQANEMETKRTEIINSIRKNFQGTLKAVLTLEAKMAWARDFLQAYRDWSATFSPELKIAATKINFIRSIDPTVPDHREPKDGKEGYRDNPSYYTAIQLFTKAENAEKAEKRAEAEAAEKAGNATAEQKKLLESANQSASANGGQKGKGGKGKTSKEKETEVKMAKLGIALWLEVMVACDVDTQNLKSALKLKGVNADLIAAIAELYEATMKRVAQEA